MEQARKRLVELLIDADYVTSKDRSRPWWERIITLGAVNNNYKNYKYYYCLNENYDAKNAVFSIDYDSIWLVFSNENNMSYQQVQDFTKSTLGEHYNFGDIATRRTYGPKTSWLGERYNY